jgi:CheY-like chemotaxis protein
MRVLLVNEPRSYREIFAGAFRVLRPHIEVVTAEPEELEEVASRLQPDAVVCSNTTPELRTAVGAWMEVRLAGPRPTQASRPCSRS